MDHLNVLYSQDINGKMKEWKIQVLDKGDHSIMEYSYGYTGGKMISCSQITANIVGHIIHNKKFLEAGSDTDRTLHAYIISNKMAKILVNTFNTCPRIDKAIDDWIMRVSLENSLPIYNAQPLLCHSPLKGDSDIR